MQERIKIRNSIYQSKIDAIQEKKQNVEKIKEQKMRARRTIAAMYQSQDAARAQSFKLRVNEKSQQAARVAMGTKTLEQQETQLLKNLQKTQNKA